MAAVVEPLAARDAIAALLARGKHLDPSFSWMDVWERDHAAMLTVAKSAGFDILTDIYDALRKALEAGTTFAEFGRDLTPVLQEKGWWGRQRVTDPLTGDEQFAQLGSSRRLRTIFDTNMRVSYASGHWASFERNKATRPFLRYVSILDDRTRPAHRARHNLVLPVDHPYWEKWAPPCGWNCRCTLQALSKRDIDRLTSSGEKLVFEVPADTERAFVNRRTGEVTKVPDGIDPGWAYNPGKEGYRAGLAGSAKLATAPPAMAAAAGADPHWLPQLLDDEFARWFDGAAAGGRVDRSTVVAGALSPDVVEALLARGIVPASAAITVTQKRVMHMLRDVKSAKVPTGLLRDLPQMLRSPRAVLRDQDNGTLLYVFDAGDQPAKLIVQLDFRSKARRDAKSEEIITNAVRTAGLVEEHNLREPRLELLAGSL